MPCLVLNHISIPFSFIFYFHNSSLNYSLTKFVRKEHNLLNSLQGLAALEYLLLIWLAFTNKDKY